MEGKVLLMIIDNLKLKLFQFINLKKYCISILKFSTFNKSYILYDAIIGDLLGDGHIRFLGKRTNKLNERVNIGNARMEFTFSTANLPYLRYLKFVAYREICTISEPTP